MPRILLTGNTSFQVNSDTGSDSNDGILLPKLTIQAMLDDLAGNYDLKGYTATIQLAGTATHAGVDFSGKIVGQKGTANLTIIGNPSSPGSHHTGALVFRCGAAVTVQGVWISSATYGLVGDDPGTRIVHSNCWFGSQFFPQTDSAIVAGVGSRIQGSGTMKLRGNCESFIKALGPSQNQLQGGASLVLENNPDFTVAFAYATEGGLINSNITVSGTSATGAQYVAALGSKIYTAGTYTSFPGTGVGNSVDSISVVA